MSRCKPGDLAIVVFSVAGNEGKLVTVLSWRGNCRYAGGDVLETWNVQSEQVLSTNTGQVWLPGSVVAFPAAWLKPIRPDGITDEEVRDLYQPEGITA